MSDYGLSATGYTAPTAVDILAVIRSAYETDTGLTIDWEADTVLGTLTAIAADRIAEIADASQALYDSFSVATAVGTSLDSLALLVGVTRLPATHGTVALTLTGTNGTVIPSGSYVVGGGTDGLARWITQASVTISAGTASVSATAEDEGVVEADAGAVDTIGTPVSGWTACTNAAPADAGRAIETDAALRSRRLSSLQIAGSRSGNALRGRLLALTGVEAAVVLHNPTIAVAVVEGVSIEPFSAAIVIYPSTITAAQKVTVAEAIFAHVAGSTKTVGAVTHTLTDSVGYAQTVRWAWATEQAVVVAVVVTLQADYVLADVQQPVLDAIAALFLSLGVGDPARMIAVQATIYGVDGVLDAVVTLNGGAATIDPNATVRLTLDPTSSVST